MMPRSSPAQERKQPAFVTRQADHQLSAGKNRILYLAPIAGIFSKSPGIFTISRLASLKKPPAVVLNSCHQTHRQRCLRF
jgi:hypothetical protein